MAPQRSIPSAVDFSYGDGRGSRSTTVWFGAGVHVVALMTGIVAVRALSGEESVQEARIVQIRAQYLEAQSNLHNAMTDAKVYFVDNGSNRGFDQKAAEIEPLLS